MRLEPLSNHWNLIPIDGFNLVRVPLPLKASSGFKSMESSDDVALSCESI